jgi:O-succinylbenzoate synthase
MFINSVELRELRLPLVHAFETSFGRTAERRIIIVCVVERDGTRGWGECTAGEGPFYCEEWTETAWTTLNEFLIPTLVGRNIKNAGEVWSLLHHFRGNRMAKAALETACWDLEAKQLGLPLWKLLGGTRAEIPCGVSIGIQGDIEQLIGKIETELSAGYQRIKIKIKPGWDLDVVRSVRQRFPNVALMVDANSAYTLADVNLFREMDRFDLMMIEQPLAHDDIVDHAGLQRQLKTAICLDESIRSRADAVHAISLGACRVVNVKLGRVGGHTQAKEVEQVCRDNNIPVWCGGMLESGIGRAHNVAMATLAGFTLPGDVSASARYWQKDIINPPVAVTQRGTIAASDKPGIGFAVDEEALNQFTVRKKII